MKILSDSEVLAEKLVNSVREKKAFYLSFGDEGEKMFDHALDCFDHLLESELFEMNGDVPVFAEDKVTIESFEVVFEKIGDGVEYLHEYGYHMSCKDCYRLGVWHLLDDEEDDNGKTKSCTDCLKKSMKDSDNLSAVLKNTRNNVIIECQVDDRVWIRHKCCKCDRFDAVHRIRERVYCGACVMKRPIVLLDLQKHHDIGFANAYVYVFF